MEKEGCLNHSVFSPGAEVRQSHLEDRQLLKILVTPSMLVKGWVSWESPDICLLNNYGVQHSNCISFLKLLLDLPIYSKKILLARTILSYANIDCSLSDQWMRLIKSLLPQFYFYYLKALVVN